MGTRRVLGASTCLAVLLSLVTGPAAAAAPAPVHLQGAGGPVVQEQHRPPVDAEVTDPYRAPEHAFGPGNRGIEYGTAEGQVVRASAAGAVIFAGQVAGNLFVTIDHGNGLWTTAGYLADINVRVGQAVAAGDRIGTAGQRLHFSARQDRQYFDPEILFGRWRMVVRLVPGLE